MTMKAPIVPSNPQDPTGADGLEKAAIRDFDRRIRAIVAAYVDGLNSIPAEPVVNRRYTFQIDQVTLSTILARASIEVEAQILEGGEYDLWFFQEYGSTAYQRGTARAFANIGQQSPAYKAGRESLGRILVSDAYRLRIGLIQAREFEEMVGISGSIKASMSRVLTDGIARGLNPRQVARNLASEAGIEARRAYRVARTEITTALRRARWEESDAAAADYGIMLKQMHFSALSPTTRISHAQRHGLLYTTDQVRDWYSQDGNSINCKCVQIETLVDSSGNPVVPAIAERAREVEKRVRESGKGPWSED